MKNKLSTFYSFACKSPYFTFFKPISQLQLKKKECLRARSHLHKCIEYGTHSIQEAYEQNRMEQKNTQGSSKFP